MIKIAICDDEAPARASLRALLQPYPCEIVEYACAADCLADGRSADIYFLDVELHSADADGMALARQLRAREPRAVIIFVTGYDRYVFDAFDVGAFQYLLKPVDAEKFARAFGRALERVTAGREAQPLTLRSASTSRTVPLDSIYYIESSNHKVALHLKDGEFTCYARIGALEEELRGRFFRIHKGYLVNLAYVEAYSQSEATLVNGEKLLISKYKYREFVRAYLRFLEQGAGL